MIIPSDNGLTGKPSYELTVKEYYSRLNAEDAALLEPFVQSLGLGLEMRSAILAVGSSTFPREYKKSYNDLDLLIIPHDVTLIDDQNHHVRRYFIDKQIAFTSKNGNQNSIPKKNPYLDIDHHPGYGQMSLTTRLSNGRMVDMIFAREVENGLTASQKIDKERRFRNPFSILYL